VFEVSTTNPAFIDPTIDSRASDQSGGARRAWGIAERVDDYCATAYVYCARP